MDTQTGGRPPWGSELWSAYGPRAPVGCMVSGLPLNCSSLVPGDWVLPTPAPGAYPAGPIQPVPRTKPSETVRKERGGAGMSPQTPQIQEYTNQASSPLSTELGLEGPSPLHDVSQWETSPLSPTPLRGQGPCGHRPALSLSPWCASSRKHGHHLLPDPILPKSNRSTFLELHLFFCGGSQDGEGKPQHPESTTSRGKFLHTVYTVFFY